MNFHPPQVRFVYITLSFYFCWILRKKTYNSWNYSIQFFICNLLHQNTLPLGLNQLKCYKQHIHSTIHLSKSRPKNGVQILHWENKNKSTIGSNQKKMLWYKSVSLPRRIVMVYWIDDKTINETQQKKKLLDFFCSSKSFSFF